jgi:small GTP-binding protein
MGLTGSKKKGNSEGEGKIYKLVMLGNGGVGKSALTIQFVQDKFIREYDPTIEDSYRKQVLVDNKVAMLNIWDTAGQEEYEALQDGYIRDADGFILVYSITDRSSYEDIKKFFNKILTIRDSNKEAIVIFGNKSDLIEQREVATMEGQELAQKLKCSFFETSAKMKTNVEEGFYSLVRELRSIQSSNGKKKIIF